MGGPILMIVGAPIIHPLNSFRYCQRGDVQIKRRVDQAVDRDRQPLSACPALALTIIKGARELDEQVDQKVWRTRPKD